MTTSSLVDFCEKHNINWFPISLTITDDKKKILNPIQHILYSFQRPKNTDFKNEGIELINKRKDLLKNDKIKKELHLNAMWIDTSEVYHIDIDTPDYDEGFDAIDTPYFKSMTKEYGKHILIKMKDFNPRKNRIQFKCEGVELLCGQASYAPFEIIDGDKDILDYPSIVEILQMNNIYEASEIDDNDIDFSKLTEIEKLLECIGSSRCKTGKFKEWYETGQAIKNEMKEEGNKYFINWTNKYGSDNKKNEAYDQITKYIKYTPKSDKKRLSIASLHFWAKHNNNELYDKLFKDVNESNYTYLSKDDVYSCDRYKATKSEFEKHYFKLESPLCYVWECKDGNLNYYKSKDIDELVRDKNLPYYKISCEDIVRSEPFIKLWKDDPNKRKYEKIVFEPNNDYSSKDYYNLFRGFKNDDETIEPIDENNSMFFKLLNHLCSVEKETYEYMKAIIAHIIQKPYMKTNIGVILYSDLKGVGKDSLIIGLNKLIGDDYFATINDIGDIAKNFNNHLVNKFIIYSDEIDARARKVADKIKSVITRTKINLEKKNFDPISVSDYSNWWFSTNHKNSFKNEEGDRRNLMIECPEVIPTKQFFDDFYKEINDPIKVRQIFRFFKLYKQDKYSIGSGRVLDTKYKKEAMLESKQSYYQFLYKAVNQYENNNYTSSSFYELSKLYANKHYLTANYSITEFGKALSKIFDNFKVRTNKGYVFKFGSKCEILKCLFDADSTYYRFVNNLDADFIPLFNNNMDDELELCCNQNL